MAATFTLVTGSIPTAIGPHEVRVPTENLSGLAEGVFLFIERELLRVIAVDHTTGVVHVQRGQSGTHASAHAAGVTAYLVPTGDLVYEQDPVGAPPLQPYVVPWINVIAGRIFWPVGDDSGPGSGARVWALAQTTYGIGPLGVRIQTSTPSGVS